MKPRTLLKLCVWFSTSLHIVDLKWVKKISKGRGRGRLRSVICIMLILIKQIIFCTDFFWSERVMVCKCIFQVRSELTQV